MRLAETYQLGIHFWEGGRPGLRHRLSWKDNGQLGAADAQVERIHGNSAVHFQVRKT